MKKHNTPTPEPGYPTSPNDTQARLSLLKSLWLDPTFARNPFPVFPKEKR